VRVDFDLELLARATKTSEAELNSAANGCANVERCAADALRDLD
jgi:hypothetical protein